MKKLSIRVLGALGLLAALATGTTGCAAEYDRTEITGVRASVLGGTVNRARMEIPSGMVVTAHVVSYNDDNNIMTMSLRAVNPDIVDVSNVISDHDFAFIGLKPGTTDVEILAGNKVVLIISAVVVPQPAAP